MVAKTLAIRDTDPDMAADWSMSARMGDVGTAGSARFAQAAIARVGQAVTLAVGEVVRALFEAVLPC